MTPPVSEMQFGREDIPTVLEAATFSDGLVVFSTIFESRTTVHYPATLGQAIQLRDFLNRHIDELALKQTGSLAQRASDDPTQLAAVEELQEKGCGRRFRLKNAAHEVSCGEQSTTGPFAVLCERCRNVG